MNKHIMIFSTAMLLCLFCKGQDDWKLKQDKDGIEIYTRPLENSHLKGIKVKCALPVTLSQLVTVIMDVNTAVEWVYSTKSSSLLKKISPSELFYYSEVSLPWPINNRDFVAHLKVSQDPHSKVVTIDGPVVPNYIPEKKDIIRVKSSYGKWVLTPQKNNVKIEYTLETDPGGSLPAWLVNLFVAKGPHETFVKLKQQLQKAQYKNATLAYIKE
jgi:hypothetical protein